jgi:succinate dehydrogenase hydrophobic anchor subunit
VRWHRAGFRCYWRWKSRPLGGRPRIDTELRALIRRMSVENPLWGAPRIHGELLKLGFEVAQSSVAQGAIESWAGQVALFGCTFAFFVHLCGGIRHLVCDAVHGFELRSIYISDRRGGGHRTYGGRMDDQPVCRGVAPMTRGSFRSPLSRALGLGAAKSGVQHWWAERVTAVALVPLCFWFAASIMAHAGSDYAVFIAWIGRRLQRAA